MPSVVCTPRYSAAVPHRVTRSGGAEPSPGAGGSGTSASSAAKTCSRSTTALRVRLGSAVLRMANQRPAYRQASSSSSRTSVTAVSAACCLPRRLRNSSTRFASRACSAAGSGSIAAIRAALIGAQVISSIILPGGWTICTKPIGAVGSRCSPAAVGSTTSPSSRRPS